MHHQNTGIVSTAAFLLIAYRNIAVDFRSKYTSKLHSLLHPRELSHDWDTRETDLHVPLAAPERVRFSAIQF